MRTLMSLPLPRFWFTRGYPASLWAIVSWELTTHSSDRTIRGFPTISELSDEELPYKNVWYTPTEEPCSLKDDRSNTSSSTATGNAHVLVRIQASKFLERKRSVRVVTYFLILSSTIPIKIAIIPITLITVKVSLNRKNDAPNIRVYTRAVVSGTIYPRSCLEMR